MKSRRQFIAHLCAAVAGIAAGVVSRRPRIETIKAGVATLGPRIAGTGWHQGDVLKVTGADATVYTRTFRVLGVDDAGYHRIEPDVMVEVVYDRHGRVVRRTILDETSERQMAAAFKAISDHLKETAVKM